MLHLDISPIILTYILLTQHYLRKMLNIPVIAHFAAATFFGNVAFSAMGFGMAICYLFVYQIGALAGLTECCALPGLKYAVFIQTIGMTVIQPIVLWNVNLRKNFRWDLILTMVPMQLVGAPLGQILQAYTPSEVLKIIVGVVTIAVAAWQAFNLWRGWRAAKQQSKYEMVEVGLEEGANGTAKSDVFFVVGSQKEDSDWLHGLISDRNPQIASPPAAGIFQHFAPIMESFGDLTAEENFKTLINSVCEFVESNPLPWLDSSKNPLSLEANSILKMCGEKRTLAAVFEAVMDTYTEAHNCNTWLCKSETTGEYHEELKKQFGSRIKFVYLYRDPRDVIQSTSNANSHVYVEAENWAKLQRTAAELPEDSVYRVNYESVVGDKGKQMDQLDDFLSGGAPDKKTKTKQTEGWKATGKLTDEDVKLIESACFSEMKDLGYKTVSKSKPKVSKNEIEEFRTTHDEGLQKRNDILREDNPKEWDRSEKQRLVLEKHNTDLVVMPLTNGNHAEHDGLLENGKMAGKKEPTDNKTMMKQVIKDISQTFWPIRPKIIWMCVAGLLSGFLAGLIGVRSPPLIIFFFVYEFPPVEVKANGAVIAAVNTCVRIITYLANPPPEVYGSPTWFVMEDIWLYVVCAVVAIIASPIGLYFTRYLNKSGYKVGLTCLLIVNGVTMVTTAVLDMAGGGSSA